MGLRRASGPIGAALGTALAVATLPGCGNQPTEPKPLENKADSQPDPTTPPTTPPATPPESPGGTWDEPAPFQTTPGEPEQFGFIRHYFDLINKAQRTGDVQPILDASEPDCKSCAGIAKVISERASNKGRLEGGYEWRIRTITQLNTEDEKYLVQWQTDPYISYPSADAKPTPMNAIEHVVVYQLQPRGETWSVKQAVLQDN